MHYEGRGYVDKTKTGIYFYLFTFKQVLNLISLISAF